MKRNMPKIRKQLSPKQQKQLKIKYAERMLFLFSFKDHFRGPLGVGGIL
jgi:hypothetical protein